MKKTLLFITSLVAIVSCTKELDNSLQNEKDVFSFEASTNMRTKTELSQNEDIYDLVWKSGDQVSISDADGNVAIYEPTEVGSTSAKLTYLSGDELTEGSTYTAYYPLSLAENKIASSQEYVAGNIPNGAFPMIAVSTTNKLQFRNLCGIVRLNLRTEQPSTVHVKNIVITADKGLSGDVVVDIPNAELTVTGTNGGITLDCEHAEEGKGVLLTAEPKPFYFVLPVGEYDSFNIEINSMDHEQEIIKLKAGKKVIVEKSKITTLSVLANEIVFTYCYGDVNTYIPESESLDIDVSAHPVYGTLMTPGSGTHTKAAVVKSAGVLWRESSLSIEGIALNENKLTVSGISGNGNAVISIYDGNDCSGNVLWSYLIWKPVDDPKENLVTYSKTGYNDLHVMPMNLGAMKKVTGDASDSDKAKGLGLYYQKFRNIPLPFRCADFEGTPVSIEGTSLISMYNVSQKMTWFNKSPYIEYRKDRRYMMNYCIQHPAMLIEGFSNVFVNTKELQTEWGDFVGLVDFKKQREGYDVAEKTAFDPCPEGYRVPPTNFPTSYKSKTGSFNKGWYFGSDFFVASGYYSGYHGSDYGLKGVGSSAWYLTNNGRRAKDELNLADMYFSNTSVLSDFQYIPLKAANLRCVKIETN